MVEKIVLPNGVRVLHERLDQVRSCAIGVWVENGSCHEPEELSGISHFIEHMLFKGTETRTAGDLARAFDALGGQVNAFTTKEHTCFYARTLDTHVQQAAELLQDMVLHSAFRPQDVELERGVILEEIGMYEDSPEDLVAEVLSGACYPGALGRPILGTAQSLRGIDAAALKSYCRQRYVAENIILSLSGSFTDQDLAAVCQAFSAVPRGERTVLPPVEYKKSALVKKKEIEQNHLLLAFPAIPAADPRRYTLAALNNILGAGMSSRLFQRVREQSGLCYTIYSYTSLYANAGALGIYVALGKETQFDALTLIREELLRLRVEGVTEEELSRTKEQLKTSLLMGLESTNTRMSALARSEMTYGVYRSPEETAEALDAVTREDVLALAREVLDFDQASFAAVGNVSPAADYLTRLELA
ncbi:MAG: insulinase family protein [Clostridia bacterium]|nr:insulinase family protein [Clostridia bacterium]